PVLSTLCVHDALPILICPSDEQVLRLMDRNVRVMQGDLSDASTFERARVQHAALITVTGDDISNANTAFSVRSRCKAVFALLMSDRKSTRLNSSHVKI